MVVIFAVISIVFSIIPPKKVGVILRYLKKGLEIIILLIFFQSISIMDDASFFTPFTIVYWGVIFFSPLLYEILPRKRMHEYLNDFAILYMFLLNMYINHILYIWIGVLYYYIRYYWFKRTVSD